MRSLGMRMFGNADVLECGAWECGAWGKCGIRGLPAGPIGPAGKRCRPIGRHLPPPDSAAASRAAGRSAGGRRGGGGLLTVRYVVLAKAGTGRGAAFGQHGISCWAGQALFCRAYWPGSISGVDGRWVIARRHAGGGKRAC